MFTGGYANDFDDTDIATSNDNTNYNKYSWNKSGTT